MSHSVDNRSRFPNRIAPGDFLPHKPKRSASSVIGGTSAGMNLSNPSPGKLNEKDLMHGLNDRLAGFIEKVHHLEHQNHLLEREVEELKGKAKPAAGLEEEYGPELRKLRRLVQDIAHQKHQIEVEHANLEDELSSLRRQHEQEARSRSDAESSIVLLKKEIGDAYLAKLQLDKKAQALVDEIHSLKRNHEAEVSGMFDQIQAAQVTVRAHDFGNPGVTAALRDIRAQLEGHTVSDFQQVGESFRSQFARLTEAAESKREALKATQQEMQEYRRSLQAKNIELDRAKGTREALEKQLHDAEDRQKEEMIHYQNTIKELENELINCKFDMSGYLREYQDLLNVKMALDVEILSYRKLLCSEEARLSTMSDTHISLPYIYHQSPVYTLPCLGRQGGPHRRAEPQFKFVEEIITETTREIEMSEFEETGSEETEVGKDERECSKRDRGGSEEEKGREDGREEDGEQMSDSEQNQVASVGQFVNGGEVDDGGKDQTSKDESEANGGVDSKMDGGIDKNTQSKVVLSESHGEENIEQKMSENTKAEEESAVTTTDSFSKVDELKLGVPVKELLEKSDAKKDAEKDSFIPAQVKKPADETSAQVSKESDKTHELSSVEGQNTVQTLPETAEKPRDFTAETMSVLSVETKRLLEKAQISSSAITDSEEKENSHTEPKELSKSEAAKGEDNVAQNIQNSHHHSNKDLDKESHLKSDAKQLPEVEGQKPNSGDETQTVQSELPKEKTTTNAEIKMLDQGTPESSRIQESKQSEASEKIDDPQAKTEKLAQQENERSMYQN